MWWGFALLLLPPFAFGCTCSGGRQDYCTLPPSSAEAKLDNQAVFLGTVTAIRTLEDSDLLVQFRVDEAYLGPVRGPRFELHSYSSICTPEFIAGQQYLVVTYRRREGPADWLVGACSPTTRANLARLEIEALRTWKQGRQPKPAIGGSITRITGPPHWYHPGESIRVRLTGPRYGAESVTDADGVFLFAGLPRGKYRVRVASPPPRTSIAYQPASNEYEIDLTRKSCGTVSLTLRPE